MLYAGPLCSLSAQVNFTSQNELEAQFTPTKVEGGCSGKDLEKGI